MFDENSLFRFATIIDYRRGNSYLIDAVFFLVRGSNILEESFRAENIAGRFVTDRDGRNRA